MKEKICIPNVKLRNLQLFKHCNFNVCALNHSNVNMSVYLKLSMLNKPFDLFRVFIKLRGIKLIYTICKS